MAKQSLKSFDAVKVARLDAAMWQAYYSHKFIKLFFLLVELFQEQFKVNFLVSVKMAYYSGKAATVFRKNEDIIKAGRYLVAFFDVIKEHAIEDFDSKQAAKTELEWWLVHRYPQKYRQSLVEALSLAMSALYSLPAQTFNSYGSERSAAMHLRDSASAEPGWTAIQAHLEKSYVALKEAINKPSRF